MCPQLKSTEIRVDNKLAIELAKKSVHHERSKHIDVRFHLIQKYIKEEVRVVHVQSNDQAVDIFIDFAEAIIRELQADVRDIENSKI
jgi:predicted class III extradiol MEMO1 family dioxygenase